MSLKYRPEIDGLRSIAIIAVILYHAEYTFKGIKLFKGGFIGVDIFFVISGYLITSIILREMNERKFSFARFYERRARRILPALFTVIFFSIPFSWMYMLPKAVKEYAYSVITTLVSASNIWFWQEDSYWAEPNAYKPFLHTWSLSVEEQFYLIFPIFLLFLWKFLKNYITPVLTLVFLLSLQVANFGSIHFPEATFFLLPTRGWELLAGSIVAKLELEKGRLSHPFLDNIMPAIGFFLICNAILFFNDKIPHPSFVTISPILGTVLIVWFCKKGELISDILGSKLFVAVGLISYSLYLWHQPIFAFARINNIMSSNYQKAGLIVLSVILAILTYFIIEKPMRNTRKISLKTLAIFLSTFVVILTLPLGYALKNNGLWGRFKEWYILNNLRTFDTIGPIYYKSIRDKDFSNDNRKNIFIIGDSFSLDIFSILYLSGLLDNKDTSAHIIPRICKNVPENSNYLEHMTSKEIIDCKNTIRIGNKALNKRLLQADLIILASKWEKFTASQIKNLYFELKKHTKAKILIVGLKNFYYLRDQYILNHKKNIGIKKDINNEKYELIKMTRSIIPHMSNDDSYLDLHTLICGDGHKCPLLTSEGYNISWDGDHFTDRGAFYVGQLLLKDKKFMQYWNSIFKN